MKKLICGMAIISAFVTVARAAELTPAEKEAKRERMMRNTGGLIDVAPKGRIVIVNAQKKFDRALITSFVAETTKNMRFNIDCIDGDFEMYRRPADAAGALVVADRPDLPMSVIAAEEVWGLMNVAKLTTGDATKDEKRFKMELARAFALTFGQVRSQFNGSAFRLVRSPEDLDGILNDGLTFDVQMLVQSLLLDMGLEQGYRSTYRRACKEGWATAPTNEYQRAIWEQVKADKERGPVNGIKIVPPNKRK